MDPSGLKVKRKIHLADKDPEQARTLIAEAYDSLNKLVDSGQRAGSSIYTPLKTAVCLLPVVEQVEAMPAQVVRLADEHGRLEDGVLPEFIDRAVELHQLEDLQDESRPLLDRLKSISNDFEGDVPSFLDTLSLDRGIDHSTLLGDRVALMSFHAAKGLEWPVVFVTGCEEGLIPCTLFGDGDDGEEKRLFYVGMTRARNSLILSHADHRMINTRHLELKRSPFLSLIPERLIRPLERGDWKPKKKRHKQLSFF